MHSDFREGWLAKKCYEVIFWTVVFWHILSSVLRSLTDGSVIATHEAQTEKVCNFSFSVLQLCFPQTKL